MSAQGKMSTVTALVADPNHYDVIIAMTHEATGGESTWYIFLCSGGEYTSYFLKGEVGAPTIHWSPYLHCSQCNDASILDKDKFASWVHCGRLPKQGLDTFKEIFYSLEKGPNQFYVCRVFAALEESGLSGGAVVTGLTDMAVYSDKEFKENGDGFFPFDGAHLKRWGANADRDPEWRDALNLAD